METQAPVQVETQPKKRVIKIKKKVVSSSTTSSIPSQPTTQAVDTSKDTKESEEKGLISIIPSSRVKNYISKEKLNKEIDTLIEKIKNSQEPIDLNSLLSADLQSKIGNLIKQKEEKKEEININAIAVDILSKQKFKFSHSSFKVLSVFLDLLIEDLTLNVMDEIIKNKKSIINVKYVFSAKSESPLSKLYSSLPTFVAEKANLEASADETPEESAETTETPEPTEDSTKSINFEFYIRKICNKLKKSKEEYSKIKVSNNYQKFCSKLVLDFLDRVVPITSILLDVMTTKTITNLVFETVLKLQLFDNEHKDELLTEIKKRLEQ